MKFTLEGRYTALIIGTLYAVLIFISTFTLVIPIITLIIPSLLEYLVSSIVGDTNYKIIGTSVLFCLVSIFSITTYFLIKRIFRKKELLKKQLFYYFTFQTFIIPSICFYISASSNWDKAMDGQFFFGILDVYPISSIVFIFIGAFIDILRNRKTKLE